MDQLLIQRTRYLLRARVRRLQTCPDQMFIDSCKQYMHWIGNHPILKYLEYEISKIEGEHIKHIEKIFNEVPENSGGYEPGNYSAESLQVHTSVCYHIIKGITQFDNSNPHIIDFLIRCLGEYLNGDDMIKLDEAISVLKDVAIDSLYEHFDEQLDERNSLYSLLIKYKQRSEWFRRNRLRDIANNGIEKKTGERALAIDVQEYILDQGVEFYIEPTSASGEVDLVLKTSEGSYIIIDAKFIQEDSTPSVIKKKISDGFHQVYRYCNDFNVHQGFLVNFVSTTSRINLDLKSIDGFPYINIGNKNIYYIEICIGDETSASKSGKATTLEINYNDLKKEVE